MLRMTRNHCLGFACALALSCATPSALAEAPEPVPGLDALYPSLEALYIDIHQNPELSLQEAATAPKLAARLRALGIEVTEGVGGHGIVGMLRNGDGPVIYLRTDMDALPIKEDTGLPYASVVTAQNRAGETVPVMHACGHDAHMAAWVGAATLLSSMKDQWSGTLVFVGQPAEEIVAGARAMIDDGLYERFPKPDYVLGIHVSTSLPSGKIGMVSGPASAASDTVDIIVHGVGGHGAVPHFTIDPIVIAARIVGTLQTIIARELNPLDSGVVTVGSFHAGTKHNIIPQDARLQLTVRSYKPQVQEMLLASIRRIALAEAEAGNAPREPEVIVHTHEGSAVCINDPALTARLTVALSAALGEENVVTIDPAMTSEDFGVFGAVAGCRGSSCASDRWSPRCSLRPSGRGGCTSCRACTHPSTPRTASRRSGQRCRRSRCR